MRETIKHKKIVLFLLVVGILGISSPSLALLVDWPDSPMGTEIHGTSELHEMVAYIYEWAITLGGLAVFIVLIIAGMQYLTSAGKPEAMRAAKDRIQNGVIGLVLLLSIWLILHTINPALTTLQPLGLDLKDFLSCEMLTGESCATSEDCVGEFGDHAQCEGGICKLDECKSRFGEYYNCEGGRCVLDEEEWLAGFTPRECASVTVWPQGGVDEEGESTGGYKRWKETLRPGDKFKIPAGALWNHYLNKHGEGFYAQVEFPTYPDRIDPKTGNPKLYENCVAHIELYKGRSLIERCVSTRERVTITAAKHPEDDGNEACATDAECQGKFGKEYACEEGVCAWIQLYVPDQLYDEYVRCMEYRQIRMPF